MAARGHLLLSSHRHEADSVRHGKPAFSVQSDLQFSRHVALGRAIESRTTDDRRKTWRARVGHAHALTEVDVFPNLESREGRERYPEGSCSITCHSCTTDQGLIAVHLGHSHLVRFFSRNTRVAPSDPQAGRRTPSKIPTRAQSRCRDCFRACVGNLVDKLVPREQIETNLFSLGGAKGGRCRPCGGDLSVDSVPERILVPRDAA